ncbi:DUF6723 family protein [Paraburkholderia sp. BR10937]|uniref:DUF6723 family protein n=1 Tax=Paraburkholderia sp. BR10937 TaxID=3236994 RepID=UPI0034D2908E
MFGRYCGYLKIRRKSDGKVIYPFDGCPTPGVFLTPAEARGAARDLAAVLVKGDMNMPE